MYLSLFNANSGFFFTEGVNAPLILRKVEIFYSGVRFSHNCVSLSNKCDNDGNTRKEQRSNAHM